MGFQTLLSDDAAPVRTLTVNRPDVLNALNAEVLVELEQAFAGIAAEVAADPVAVRCVILTGAGDKAFAAGADIAAMAAMGPEQARRFSDLGRRLADRVEGLPVPVIAAVNGFALGGGLELALLCDFMLASSNAKLGQPEVNVGVLPGFGGTQRLGRRIGVGPARQLLYTGELVGAEEARALGLVNEVTAPPELLPRARALAGASPAGRRWRWPPSSGPSGPGRTCRWTAASWPSRGSSRALFGHRRSEGGHAGLPAEAPPGLARQVTIFCVAAV